MNMHETSGTVPRFRAVLFDMDGVLTDNLRLHLAAWADYLRERFGVEIAAGDRRFQSGLNHEIYERVLGRKLPPAEARAFHEEKEARYMRLAHGVLGPVGGLHTYLGWLEARRIPKALVTGSDRKGVAFCLGQLGLTGRFPVVVTSEDVRRGKPSPEAFLLGASRLGVLPTDCLVHEDSEGGIASALTAGAAYVAAVATTLPAPALLAAGAGWAGADFDAWIAELERGGPR